jgi:2-polyprenyl-6-methoxyphenol hydroxylase-like FAD-dependent oxidoreductase
MKRKIPVPIVGGGPAGLALSGGLGQRQFNSMSAVS